MSDFGLRYYSATLGRWLNRDPLGDLGGANVYVIIAASLVPLLVVAVATGIAYWYARPLRRRVPVGRLAVLATVAQAVAAAVTASLGALIYRTLTPHDDWHDIVGSAAGLLSVAAIPFVGLVAYGICRAIEKRGRAKRMDKCDECGYDLTGNVSGRCPECGTPVREPGR